MKKAQAVISFGIIITILAALVIIIMMIIFTAVGCVNERAKSAEIKSASENIDVNLMLLNSLRTPAPISGSNITLAELGIITLYDTSYNNAFDNQLYVMYNKLPYVYYMEIKKGNRDRYFGDSAAKKGSSASAEIPSPDFGIVEYKLYLYKK
jgi:hypothetical protein